ncbi:hypothetical protein LI291_16425, partial [Intestinibacillus massiliensis]|nr:hypothetical protein [Intestinibacillus massiliensis]
ILSWEFICFPGKKSYSHSRKTGLNGRKNWLKTLISPTPGLAKSILYVVKRRHYAPGNIDRSNAVFSPWHPT